MQNNHKSLFIMTGKELKEILDDLGVVGTHLAEKLGTSQANFSASLKVNDIKTGYIERIAHAIHVPVIYFYDRAARMGTTISEEEEPSTDTTPVETEKAPAANDMQQVLLHLTALVTTQNKKIDELSKQLADLTTLVSNQRNTTQFVFADSSLRQVADTTEIK